jgi:hypothetical protein
VRSGDDECLKLTLGGADGVGDILYTIHDIIVWLVLSAKHSPPVSGGEADKLGPPTCTTVVGVLFSTTEPRASSKLYHQLRCALWGFHTIRSPLAPPADK